MAYQYDPATGELVTRRNVREAIGYFIGSAVLLGISAFYGAKGLLEYKTHPDLAAQDFDIAAGTAVIGIPMAAGFAVGGLRAMQPQLVEVSAQAEQPSLPQA